MASLVWASVGPLTFLLNPSPRHCFQSMRTDQGQFAKSHFLAEPHPPHLPVQAFCPLGLCFFTCWSLHIFSSLVAPAFCRKGGRSRRAATANSISLTSWGDEQSKYLYSEGWDLSLPHDFRISASLAGEDKNLASLMKESKIERKTGQLA